MSNESEPNDLDRDVDASMRMFERSQVGPAAAIAPLKPSRILLILDGSPQDATSVDAANHLREECNVETLVLDARDPTHDVEVDIAIKTADLVSGARPIRRKDVESYDAILEAVSEHAVDMMIMPCPFGRSFDEVGADSAGTVIDVLLARCHQPMLIIRRDDQLLGQCSSDVRMIVGSECEQESRAAAWAFGLASADASISLDLVVEREQYENIRSIVEALAPEASFDTDKFSEALTKTHQAIHGAMAKTAAAHGMTYRLRPQAGESAPPNLQTESRKMLLVLPLEIDDRFGQGFVQDRVRRSPHPVLIVPGA